MALCLFLAEGLAWLLRTRIQPSDFPHRTPELWAAATSNWAGLDQKSWSLSLGAHMVPLALGTTHQPLIVLPGTRSLSVSVPLKPPLVCPAGSQSCSQPWHHQSHVFWFLDLIGGVHRKFFFFFFLALEQFLHDKPLPLPFVGGRSPPTAPHWRLLSVPSPSQTSQFPSDWLILFPSLLLVSFSLPLSPF